MVEIRLPKSGPEIRMPTNKIKAPSNTWRMDVWKKQRKWEEGSFDFDRPDVSFVKELWTMQEQSLV